MKTFIKLFALILCLTLVIAMAISCKKDENKPNYEDYQGTADGDDTAFVTTPVEEEENDDAYIKSAPTNDEVGWGPLNPRP